MQKLIVSLLTLTLASGVFAAASDPTKTLRLEANEAHKTVRLSTHEGDTPLVRCYLYQNGEAWTLDGTETASLAYSVDGWDEATNMVSIAGTVTANAYVDFQLDGDDTATNGQFYGQIQISDDSPSRSWVWSELRLEIRKSPIGSSGALTLNNPVNWNNTGPYTGTWPIVAGTNVVVESTTSNLTINSIKYTDAEALAAAIAGGCITSGVSVADNNTFTGTNTFTQTILGTASNATAVSGTAGATVVSGAALGATAIQAADLGDAAYSNASDFASAAQGALADSALQAEADTLATVTARGATTTNTVSFDVWSGGTFGAGRNPGLSATGTKTVYLGELAGKDSTGDRSVYVGPWAGELSGGDYSVFSGYTAGYSAFGYASHFYGYGAGRSASVTNAVIVGEYAGRNATGSHQMFVGMHPSDPGAGHDPTVDDQIWVDGNNDVLYLGSTGGTVVVRGTQSSIDTFHGAPQDLGVSASYSITPSKYQGFASPTQAYTFAISPVATVRQATYGYLIFSSDTFTAGGNMYRIGDAWTPTGTNMVVCWPHSDGSGTNWYYKGVAQ